MIGCCVSRLRSPLPALWSLALCLVVGCGVARAAVAASDPAALAAYARGMAARAAGDGPGAYAAFAAAYAADSTAAAVYVAMMEAAAEAGYDSLVVRDAPRASRFAAAVQLRAALLEAGARMRAHDSVAALAALRRAVAAAPDSAPLHALLAHAAVESGDTLTGIDELSRAAALDSTDADPWFQLGVLRAARNDLDGARSALERAAALARDEPAIEQALGLVAQQAGDAEAAQRHFHRAAELSPDSPAARIDKAEALAEAGDPDAGAAELERLRGSVPESVVERRLMMLWWRAGRPDTATRHARVLQRLKPDDPLPHLVLGYLALDRSDFGAAETSLRAAWLRDSTTADVAYALGIALHRQKKDRQAVAPLRQAVRLMPDSAGTALYALGLALAASGDTAAALDTLRLAEAADTTVAGPPYAMAEIYQARRHWDEAATVIFRVLRRDSTNAAAWNFVGYMFADAGIRLEDALGYVTRALALDPGNAAILDSHGWVLYRLGRYPEAREALAKATAAAPDEPEIAEHLGDVYVALGQVDDARRAYQAALRADRHRDSVLAKLAHLRRGASLPPSEKRNSR